MRVIRNNIYIYRKVHNMLLLGLLLNTGTIISKGLVKSIFLLRCKYSEFFDHISSIKFASKQKPQRTIYNLKVVL